MANWLEVCRERGGGGGGEGINDGEGTPLAQLVGLGCHCKLPPPPPPPPVVVWGGAPKARAFKLTNNHKRSTVYIIHIMYA